jgi:hypothetical protein
MSAKHGRQTPFDGIHGIAAYEYADAAARVAATGFQPWDRNKIAHQLDDDSYWVLVDESPITWQLFSSSCTSLILPPSATDPPGVYPAGSLYTNTAINMLMAYDTVRGKWLATSSAPVTGGRNGNTLDGTFYRGSDGMMMDASNRGIPVHKGTLVSVSWSRTDSDPATLEVYVGGVAIAELLSSAAGLTVDDTIDADFNAGLMSFRNKAGGNTTSDVQIVVEYRRRV